MDDKFGQKFGQMDSQIKTLRKEIMGICEEFKRDIPDEVTMTNCKVPKFDGEAV